MSADEQAGWAFETRQIHPGQRPRSAITFRPQRFNAA
jgi:hypothetical protein